MPGIKNFNTLFAKLVANLNILNIEKLHPVYLLSNKVRVSVVSRISTVTCLRNPITKTKSYGTFYFALFFFINQIEANTYYKSMAMMQLAMEALLIHGKLIYKATSTVTTTGNIIYLL